MDDQANEAIDPMDEAINLIANSEESDTPEVEDDEEEQDDFPEGEEEQDEPPAPKEVLFAGQKFAIPEGTPEEVVVKVEELGKQLQGDYTRKTQELATREQQAVQVVQRELDTGRQQVQQGIQMVQALVQAVGGLQDPAALAQLAETDPGEWVKANARQQQVMQYLQHLQSQQSALEQQAAQLEAQRLESAKSQAWQRLTEEGISRDGLQKLWHDAKASFPFLTDEKLGQVLDAESWLVLKDAIAYRQLKAQKPAVAKQVAEAPKLPQGKKPMSQDDRARLDARKAVQRRGGAGMRDLAAFLATNQR